MGGDEEEGSDEAPCHEGSGSASGHEGDEEEGSDEAPGHEGSGSTSREGDEEEGSDEAPCHEGSGSAGGHEGHAEVKGVPSHTPYQWHKLLIILDEGHNC